LHCKISTLLKYKSLLRLPFP